MKRTMKKILCIICFLCFVSVAFAQDTKEVLSLKRDLAQERVARIKAELDLMKVQYREGQEVLKAALSELEKLNKALKPVETKN